MLRFFRNSGFLVQSNNKHASGTLPVGSGPGRYLQPMLPVEASAGPRATSCISIPPQSVKASPRSSQMLLKSCLYSRPCTGSHTTKVVGEELPEDSEASVFKHEKSHKHQRWSLSSRRLSFSGVALILHRTRRIIPE